jgi:hypothetical protein
MTGKRPSALNALLVLALIGGLLVWWVSALTNEDPLWFLRSFTAQADWITVYWDGQMTVTFPGDSEYTAMMETFAGAIKRWTGYETGVGMSDETLALLRSEGRLVEVHYDQPVKVHTRHLFPEAHVFFVPLSGTHAKYQRVFSGLTDVPRIGVLNMSEEGFAAFRDAVQEAAQHSTGPD